MSDASLVMATPKLLALHDESIIQFFSRSVKITAVPVLGVIASITLVLYAGIESNLIWLWVGQALVVQIPRVYLSFLIADEAKGTIEYRKKLSILLALIGGISMALVAAYTSLMSIETKALISIILISTVAASFATCHGYKPIYLSFVLPIFIAVLIIWSTDAAGEFKLVYRVIGILVVLQLAVVFYGLVTRIHANFCVSLVSQDRSESALHAEKLANSAKTRFLAAASHDLRQPLHTMSLFSAALTTRPLDETSKSIANKMNEAMKALADELDSLLDISKLDAGIVPVQRSDIDLSGLVNRVASLFTPIADQKKIALYIDVQSGLSVHSDAKLIERLLRNVIDNAVKYTQQGSVTCRLRDDNGVALLTIQDTGPGISQVEHQHIWEEFYQVDNSSRNRQQGLGLGLSVVSRLAGMLDIKVRLVPGEGDGACFEIAIPYIFHDSEQGIRKLPGNDIADNSFLKNRHVLVVDDDEEIQQGTKFLLNGMGMKVSVANGTDAAIKIYKNEAIDVVLMDLRLSEGDDGFDAIQKLKALNKKVAVVVMSGDTAPERLKHAETIGCTWLVKPMKLDLLVDEFRRIFS